MFKLIKTEAKQGIAASLQSRIKYSLSNDKMPEILRDMERDHGPALRPEEITVHHRPTFLNARDLSFGKDAITIEARGVAALVKLDQSYPRSRMAKPKYSVSEINLIDTALHESILGCSLLPDPRPNTASRKSGDWWQRDQLAELADKELNGPEGAEYLETPGHLYARYDVSDGAHARRRAHSTIVDYAIEAAIVAIGVYLRMADERSREQVSKEFIELTGDALLVMGQGLVGAHVGALLDLCPQKVGTLRSVERDGKRKVEYQSAEFTGIDDDGNRLPNCPELFAEIELHLTADVATGELLTFDLDVDIMDTASGARWRTGETVYRFSARKNHSKTEYRVHRDHLMLRASDDGDKVMSDELRQKFLRAALDNGF